MRYPIRVMAMTASISVLAVVMVVGPSCTASAQDEARPVRTAQGGYLAVAGSYQFEVFSYRTGLRIFPQGSAGAALDATRLTGTATFYHPNSPRPWFSRPLHPAAAGPGQASESLDLVVDLSTVPPAGAWVAIEIGGLTVPTGPAARFSVPFEPVTVAEGRPDTRPATSELHGYAPIASEARYFPLAGYYSTSSGVVWVPAPGYYHVVPPTQYYPPASYRTSGGWSLAHPAPSPRAAVMPGVASDLSGIHTEYYWHPRAMDDPISHKTWIRLQLQEKYAQNPRP